MSKGKGKAPDDRLQLTPPRGGPGYTPQNLEDDPQWRLLQLRRDTAQLKADIHRLRGLVFFKDEVLLHCAHILEEVLETREPISADALKRLISRLKGAKDRS